MKRHTTDACSLPCSLHTACMQAAYGRLQVVYERMQLAFVDSLLSSVINKYSLGQFIMVDVDAVALAGVIYGVTSIVAAFEL